MPRIAFKTPNGISYHGLAEELLASRRFEKNKGEVNLILTSPPFPLNRKKKYGNHSEEEYLSWLSALGPIFSDYLSDDGSLVIELGNSWKQGSPTMSTLALRALLSLLEEGDFQLCQQFVWYNKAKLPTPAPWVTRERIRVKDAFTNIWWMAKTERPKADNKRVLIDYSVRMTKLLNSGKYNSGHRPSEHKIGEKSFLKDNGGAIPSNVLISSNTRSKSPYQNFCRERGIQPHPARMPSDTAEFFISFLTDRGDLVLDPFAGSNTTGSAAESLERRWMSIEPNLDYISGSIGRFGRVRRSIKGI